MGPDDLILVSVDDHVVEPPDVFADTLDPKWSDVAPQQVRKPDGTDVWIVAGHEIPNVGVNAVAGRPKEEYGIDPTSYDEMRRGCWDVDERIKDMDAAGVLGSMCFPSFPGFAGRAIASIRHESPEGALAVLRAYNDWHVHQWCGAHPGRFIPLALPVLWDPDEAAAEVVRMAELGCHAVTFPENPVPLKLPSLHDRHWDPLWAACEDTGTVVCMHIGSSSKLVVTAPDAPVDVLISLQPMNIVQAAGDLVWSRVLKEFPRIKVALSEGGIGWIPYFLDRIDRTYDQHRAWTGQDLGGLLPSEVFKRNVLTCFIHDRVGLRLWDEIGAERMTWEMDYPHSDSTWPDAPELLWDQIRALPADAVEAITHGTAMEWFSYAPFAHRSREDATVGALRAGVEGHDIAVRSMRREGATVPAGASAADIQSLTSSRST